MFIFLNNLGSVDENFSGISTLKMLDLRYNNIRKVPEKLESKEFLLLDGNPIGYSSPEKNGDVSDFLLMPF